MRNPVIAEIVHRAKSTEEAFRELRAAWFRAHVEHRLGDRECEIVEGKAHRERANARMREIYDEQTEAIIAGARLPLAPRCMADVAEHRQGGES